MTKIEVRLEKRGGGPNPETDWLFQVHVIAGPGSYAANTYALYAKPEDVQGIVKKAMEEAMQLEQSQ